MTMEKCDVFGDTVYNPSFEEHCSRDPPEAYSSTLASLSYIDSSNSGR